MRVQALAVTCISSAAFIMVLLVYNHVSQNIMVFTYQQEASDVVVFSDVRKFVWPKSSDARPACSSKVRISLLKGGHILINNENISNTGGDSMGFENEQHSCDPSELVTIELRDADDKDKKVIQINRVENKDVSCPREPIVSPFDLPITGLLSHPGSGNTWTRHLIQQLTGIQTGAVYNDKNLKNSGFPGEGLREGVIAIKSHTVVMLKNIHTRQIMVIRNPYESFVAEYKRGQLHLGHTGTSVIVPDENWVAYLQRRMMTWTNFVRACLDSPYDQHIIIYEDLKNCLQRELLFLALFLKTEDLTQFSVCCAMVNNEGENHRESSGQSVYDLYNETLRQQMNEMLTTVGNDTKPRFPMLFQRILAYRKYSKKYTG